MKDPHPQFEKKILLDVVGQMRNPEITWRKQMRLRRVILGYGSIALLTAFFLALNEVTHAFASAFLAAAAGCAIGFGLFLEFGQKQWPVTSRHIDLESVRKRLDELEQIRSG